MKLYYIITTPSHGTKTVCGPYLYETAGVHAQKLANETGYEVKLLELTDTYLPNPKQTTLHDYMN